MIHAQTDDILTLSFTPAFQIYPFDEWRSLEVSRQQAGVSHADTPDTGAINRSYVNRFPTTAAMKLSSRLSVWRLTSPSFNRQENSLTYRCRCFADA